MRGMPRPRKPYIQKETTRHGKVVWYFRRGKEARIRLPWAFGSAEFNKAYDAALTGTPVAEVTKATKTTLRWLVNQYYQSARYDKYQPNTKRNQRLALEEVCEHAKNFPYREITPADIKRGLMRREKTPRMAEIYLVVMRALFEFAKDNEWVTRNPTDGIKTKSVKTDGYHVWTVDEVTRYQAKHPVGTQARLALDIMLYTGLRRSDAITLGPQHIKGGVISIRAQKNKAEIVIPLLPPLAESISATTTGDMVLLLNTKGASWKNISFGYWFAARCEEAKVPGRAHGLRKAGATIAANNGATPYELTAMFGWSSTKMAEVYTRKADRALLAERAANKLYPHQPKGAGKTPKKKTEIK